MWSDHIPVDFDEKRSSSISSQDVDILIKFENENFHRTKNDNICIYDGAIAHTLGTIYGGAEIHINLKWSNFNLKNLVRIAAHEIGSYRFLGSLKIIY